VAGTTRRRQLRRSVSAATLVALVAGMVGACGGSDSDGGAATGASAITPASTSLETAEPSAPPGTTTSVPVLSETEPVGLIALGHSGLTAENSDPDKPGQPALENSWATGTNPDVNSIYLRLIEVRRETEGHIANTAVGGGRAAQLASQAEQALNVVPTPELVIIQTIDNDIRCPLAGADHFTQFGDSLTEALNVIVAASPRSRILMVGQRGRPSHASLEELLAVHPEVAPELSGTGPCVFLDTDGEVIDENIDGLLEIIEAYEAEQQRRCDAVPQCRTDEGAHAAYVEEVENLSSDLNHLNVRGQAQVAELIWPVVADMLQLDARLDQSVSSTDPAD
jgi:hypothetical protein